MTESKTTKFYLETDPDSVDELVELCRLWWPDSPFYKHTQMAYIPDTDFFKEVVRNGSGLMINGRLENQLIASYAFLVTPYMFNPNMNIATEIVWCVHPDYRKSTVATRLLHYVNETMPKLGVDLWSLAVPEDEKTPLLDRFVKKSGFTKLDNLYFNSTIGV